MPTQSQSPFPSIPQGTAAIPALHLFPLNDSFVPKQISLAQGRVRIGRQTNAKTVPGERNGYFDSKVLSRMHAEVWEENGKILIKDVKSSNGTFINSERLSPEGVESEPFELKSEDIVEFGIDIVGEDNKTIIHHKVAAKVYCILAPDDLNASARENSYHRNPSQRLPNNVVSDGTPQIRQQGVPQQQQQQQQQQGQAPQGQGQQQQTGQALGGMAGARAPGKSGLTFDHLLSRLQGELVKSRETGQDLGLVGREMGEIGETLSGGLPPSAHPPHFPAVLPPVRPPASPSGAQGSSPGQAQASGSTSALSSIQSQLHETRASLATHADKVRSLESLLQEHDALKREVAAMRDAMEESRRLVEGLRRERERDGGMREDVGVGGEEEEDADSDTRSILTVVQEDVEGEREEARHPDGEAENEADPDADGDGDGEAERREEVGRPGTPEPTGHGLDEDDDPDNPPQPPAPAAPVSPPQPPPQITINGYAHEHSDSPPSPTVPLPPPATVAAPDYIPRAEHEERYNSLAAQLSEMVAQMAGQAEVVRALEARLAGVEGEGSWGGRVGALEGWREEERRRREEEWVSVEDEDRARVVGEGETSPEEERSKPARPRRTRRRSKPRKLANGSAGGARSASPASGSGSGSGGSSASGSGSGSGASSRRTKASSGRPRSESQSTAVGSEPLASADDKDNKEHPLASVDEEGQLSQQPQQQQQPRGAVGTLRGDKDGTVASTGSGTYVVPTAVGVVVVGVIAWAVMTRIKD